MVVLVVDLLGQVINGQYSQSAKALEAIVLPRYARSNSHLLLFVVAFWYNNVYGVQWVPVPMRDTFSTGTGHLRTERKD